MSATRAHVTGVAEQAAGEAVTQIRRALGRNRIGDPPGAAASIVTALTQAADRLGTAAANALGAEAKQYRGMKDDVVAARDAVASSGDSREFSNHEDSVRGILDLLTGREKPVGKETHSHGKRDEEGYAVAAAPATPAEIGNEVNARLSAAATALEGVVRGNRPGAEARFDDAMSSARKELARLADADEGKRKASEDLQGRIRSFSIKGPFHEGGADKVRGFMDEVRRLSGSASKTVDTGKGK